MKSLPKDFRNIEICKMADLLLVELVFIQVKGIHNSDWKNMWQNSFFLFLVQFYAHRILYV